MPTLSTTQSDATREEEGLRSHLYVALESDRPATGGVRFSLEGVDEVVLRRGDARGCERDASQRRIVLTLPDPRISSTHARLFRTDNGWVVEDGGSTNGTFVSAERVERQTLSPKDLLQVGGTFLLLRLDEPTPVGAPAIFDPGNLAAAHPARATLVPKIAADLVSVVMIGASKLSILVVGETGSGKEILVRALHEASGRAGPFVAVNCGAIPESLVEGHLFGHAKGSFSGANTDALGLVRAADGGTLFLDEVGDLRPSSQAALLRVLQEREVLPVGATRSVKVDVRVISATHRRVDLADERGTFRSDLYARLGGYVHRLVPLRDRLQDMGLLVGSVLGRLDPARAPSLRLAPSFAQSFFSHAWPLNIRELHNVLEAALILSPDGILRQTQAPKLDASATGAAPQAVPASRMYEEERSPRPRADDEAIQRELVASLKAHHGNITDVARALGRTRMQIHRWMKRFGVDANAFRR